MNRKILYVMKWILKKIYPSKCVFCECISEIGICENCREKIIYIEEPCCKKCGKPIRYEEQEFCYDCSKNEYAFDAGKCLWLHKEPVNLSIYRFKYQNRRIYAEVFAKEMANQFCRQVKRWGIEGIIPIPLSKRKRQIRGYNQAASLAKQLGERLGIPVEEGALIRKRDTTPQKKLGNRGRKRNLKGAFGVEKEWNCKRNVLLVDDIYTTGSTLHEAAKQLKKSGVLHVYFLTISIGQGF